MEFSTTSLSRSRRRSASGQCAVCYTDFWAAYAQVIPSKRHQAVGNIVARLTILNALIIQCVKEFLVWLERLYPSLKS